MENAQAPDSPHIGTLSERSLHASLKDWLIQPGDQIEVQVGSYVIDIVKKDRLVEIQTGSFSAIKKKLEHLLQDHKVQLIYPIPKVKYILKQELDGTKVSRKRSPKRGRVEEVFRELIRIPHLLAHPDFSLLVVMVEQEVVWLNDGKGSWRRKYWSIADQRLTQVLEKHRFDSPQDYLDLLPKHLPSQFTNKDLASSLKIPAHLARKITYCLRKMEALEVIGKQGNANIHIIDTNSNKG